MKSECQSITRVLLCILLEHSSMDLSYCRILVSYHGSTFASSMSLSYSVGSYQFNVIADAFRVTSEYVPSETASECLEIFPVTVYRVEMLVGDCHVYWMSFA
jgi:hypothetical protein